MDTPPQKMRESGWLKEVWVAFNRLNDFCRSIAPVQSGSQGVIVARTSNGTQLKIDRGLKSVGGELKRFRLVSVQNDYYICNPFEGEENEVGTEEVNIAKYEELRHTGWHGQTIVYSFPSFPESPGQLAVAYTFLGPDYRTALFQASSGSVTEYQMIHPILRPAHSVILASKSENGTGVSDANEWIEVSSRAWAKVA